MSCPLLIQEPVLTVDALTIVCLWLECMNPAMNFDVRDLGWLVRQLLLCTPYARRPYASRHVDYADTSPMAKAQSQPKIADVGITQASASA